VHTVLGEARAVRVRSILEPGNLSVVHLLLLVPADGACKVVEGVGRLRREVALELDEPVKVLPPGHVKVSEEIVAHPV